MTADGFSCITQSCTGCGKIITSELETVVYQQMVKKLASYKTLTGRKKASKANPKIAALQVELAHVDSEIEKLVDSLTGANNVLLSYVNVKIAELDGRKQELLARIAELGWQRQWTLPRPPARCPPRSDPARQPQLPDASRPPPSR